MRNLKKFLALVLAMVMAFSLMLTANATTTGTQYSDASGVTPAFEEAVDVLTGMKVFQGDAEAPTFRPGSSITRAEVAAIIYRLVTGDVTDSQAGLYTTQHPFTDVAPNAWYAGYVGYLHNAKIIKGTTTTTFNPRENVTGYEALAMILRAVGYDKNDEFTGPTWRIEVNSTSKTLGILKDVDTTIYGGTLHLAARRDVVASLLFNTAAYVPMVKYTLAFGYQDTGMEGGVVGSTKNPTLGYKIFGLTHNTGVVVGNEVTGEAAGTTKIGFSLNSQIAGSNISIEVDNNGAVIGASDNQTRFLTAIDDGMNIRTNKGSAYVYESDTTNALPENVTRSFKFSTDLRMFNHAVKVWYDNRSSQYETVGDIDGNTGTAQFSTNLTTYAYFDKVVNTAVVSLEDTADLGALAAMGNLGAAATNNWNSNRTNNWKAPGFTLRNNGTDYLTYFNYSFGPISPANYGSDPTSSASADSPVLKNDETDEWNLYLLISNSANKALDVVIPLDMTMTQIVQANNTTSPFSVGVLAANEAGATTAGANQYFGVAADDGKTNVAGTTTNYVSLAQANLKNSPKLDLGTKVAAIEITGTAGGNAYGRIGKTVADPDWGFAWPQNPLTSTYYYQLTENTLHRTATVIKVDYASQDVTLSDGTVLHQSVFAEATDATFTTQIEGSNAATSNQGTFLQAGRDYTFTLDEQGNYIYWTTASNTAKFVYGTYIDFTTKTASSTFDYPLVYVGTDGKMGQENIVKVTDANVTAPVDLSGGVGMGYSTYNALQLPKRDNNNAAATAGYEKGRYVGYALDSNGNLVAVTDTNSQDTGYLMADTTNFGANPIQITSLDVSITAKAVDSANKLYLTNNTQFYLVDGAGTDNQKVTAYKGLAELMAGMDSVTIDGKNDITSRFLAPVEDPYKMIYYQAGIFEYAQNYDPSALEIKTVFIPAACVDFNKSIDDSLVFIGDSNSTMVTAINAHATQYTMYKDGVAGDYWIAGWESEANTAANAIDTNGNNVFYRLVDTGKTAADGKPIYTIRAVAGTQAAASQIVIGKYYNGTTAANGDITTSTEWTLDPGAAALTTWAKYYATTYSSQVGYITYDANTDDLYNVGNATVKNLDKGTYPGINDTLTALNNASSLVNNVGVPVSCVLNTADTNARTVSVIYVNAYVAP